MIISQRGRSKQGIEKTEKRHTLKRRRFFFKQIDVLQNACKQQKRRTNDGERTENEANQKKKRNKR